MQTLQQNKDLKAKLQEIHNITDVNSILPAAGTPAGDNDEPTVSCLLLFMQCVCKSIYILLLLKQYRPGEEQNNS